MIYIRKLEKVLLMSVFIDKAVQGMRVAYGGLIWNG